jgi:radical SAM-linked protein
LEDVAGIADLSKRVKNMGKEAGGGEVNVAVSSFVPKPHTPFQWEPQISYEEILEKQEVLRRELKKRKLNFKWQDAPLSVMEGVFARGDRRLGKVLIKARELGCRFDGWGEHFSFAGWREAFRAAGIDPLFYHRRRSLDEILPWGHLDYGLSPEFLRGELTKSGAGRYTPDCRKGKCVGCGVCDFKKIGMVLNGPDEGRLLGVNTVSFLAPPAGNDEVEKIRIRFSKTGRMSLLSHLEQLSLFTRAVTRGGIPIIFSKGFHPHPKFSFATALPVGVESLAEYLDMEVAAGCDPDMVKERLNAVLPSGMRIMEAKTIPRSSPSLSVITDSVLYRLTLPKNDPSDLQSRVDTFMGLESFPFRREKKGKTVELDLRHELVDLRADGNTLEMNIRRGKPLEIAEAVTGLKPAALAGARIEKLEVFFKE